MSSKPVLLLLGAGPRVGTAIAKKFASNGYQVATVSRKGTGSKTAEGYLSLQADLSQPDSVPSLFDQVKEHFNAAPTVVVYNAGFYASPPDAKDPFSLSLDALKSDLDGNVVTPFAAAKEAVKGWASLPPTAKKTFIYTGNGLNTMVVPVAYMMSLGAGKSAAAYWIGAVDQLKPVEGARFYYADERFADGQVKGTALDGGAHGEFYFDLAEGNAGEVPWQATFVKDKGYVKF